MTFIGRLKQHCEIWRRWNGERRLRGELCSVSFVWEQGNIYRTAPLTAEQITLLKGHESIVLEALAMELPVQQPSMVEAESSTVKPARSIVLGDKPPWQKQRRG
jgi:hypothetical protein